MENESYRLQPSITFIQENSSFVVIPEIKHGVSNYSFSIEGDSIKANGFAPNWPPFYCTLYLENQNELHIVFYTLESKGFTHMVYYKKPE